MGAISSQAEVGQPLLARRLARVGRRDDVGAGGLACGLLALWAAKVALGAQPDQVGAGVPYRERLGVDVAEASVEEALHCVGLLALHGGEQRGESVVVAVLGD